MIDLKNISVQFSGQYLFEDVNLKILPQDRIALVGSNGTGKSTLLKILSGHQIQETGIVQTKKGATIGFLPQELITTNTNTVFDEVRDSLKKISKIEIEEKKINGLLNDPNLSSSDKDRLLDKLDQLNEEKVRTDYFSIDSMIKKILTGLGFNEKSFSQKLSELSGGWQMRVELAKILAAENDLILLDEPTNHLDIDSLQWLVKFLKSYNGAIILVSHDRFFVNNICSKTLEIFNNKLTFYKGNYNQYLSFKTERDEKLRQELAEQQRNIKQTKEFIERFRYKATKAKQVQSRIKQLDKIELIKLESRENKIHFNFFDAPNSGVIPLKALNISKSFGENLVLKSVDLQIERGEKIALVGPNGAGKTTFAKIMSNRLKPDQGEIEFGHNTILSFYAQDVVDNLNIGNDIITEIAQSDSENTTVQLRTILGAFLFHGDDVFKKIKVLSGGEKSRVALAKVLLAKANTIILDEPTNHLDFESKKIIQDALIKFNGTIIIVSHDIDFLKPIITKVVEVRNNSLKEFYGGIEYYLTKIDEVEEEQVLNNEPVQNKLSKKDEKRIEAKRRQEEYEATRQLKEKISLLEEEIESLEQKKTKLENDLMQEEIYSNPDKARLTQNDFENTKNELNKHYDEWTEVSNELEEVLQKFRIE